MARRKEGQGTEHGFLRAEALVNAIPVMACLTDVNGRVTHVNPRWLEFTGTTLAENLGTLDFGTLGENAIHPDDRAEVQRAWQAAVQRVQSFDLECRVRDAHGNHQRLHGRMDPLLDHTGSHWGWIATATPVLDAPARQATAAFAHLVAHAPFGVYVVDEDFRIAAVSTGALPAFQGIEPLIGRDFAEVIGTIWPQPFAGEVIARFKHTLLTSEPYRSADTTERRADRDSEESYDWTLERLTLPDGRFGVVCYFYDLTERQHVQAEREALLRAVAVERGLLEALFRSAAVGFTFLDRDLRYQRVNDALAEINGIPAAEHIGRHLTEVVPEIAPRITDEYNAVLETREPIIGEEVSGETARSPGELRHWIEYVYPVTGANDAVEGLGVMVVEHTERKRTELALKESEARWRALVQATTQFVWRAYPDREDPQSAAYWMNLTGQPPQESANGGWLQAVHPDDRAQAAEGWRRGLERLETISTEYRVLRPDGSVVHLAVRGVPMLDDAGGLREWIGTFTDVTVEREATARLRAVNEAQRRFVSDAAHELRAPLTSIRGNLDLMRRYPNVDPAERMEMLEDAGREVTRLTRLITDLLSVARGEAQDHFVVEGVRLDRLLETAWRSARALSAQRRFELGTLAACRVSGDPDALQQLALILLENAVKYTPDGGVVALETRVIGDEVEWRVRDSGMGIAPEDLERVFDRFYRADRARARGTGPGGTGLGLTIARQIVERHGGRIWLESAPGAGTTAVVRLKLEGAPLDAPLSASSATV
jgi:PAS domain S-box-containing protein